MALHWDIHPALWANDLKTKSLLHCLALVLVGLTLLLTAAGTIESAVKSQLHAWMGALALLTAAVLAWQSRTRAALSALLFAAAGGLRMLETGSMAAVQVAHALLAQGLLSSALLAALESAPGWPDAAPIEDGGWPRLRHLAWLTPAVTLLQIALGAAFRHNLTGLVPHVSWAFATAICVMMAGTFVLTQPDSGRLLRRISMWLLILTGTQVLLGVAAYVARIDPSFHALALAPAAHVATGSLVMALACAWAAVVWRDTGAAVEPASLNSGRTS